jgi:hypothetical protein
MQKKPAKRKTQKPECSISMVSREVYQDLMNKELRLSQNFEKLRVSSGSK